jgi:hypothetical protein
MFKWLKHKAPVIASSLVALICFRQMQGTMYDINFPISANIHNLSHTQSLTHSIGGSFYPYVFATP